MAPRRNSLPSVTVVIWVILAVLFAAFIVLIIRALLKYLKSSDNRKESVVIKKSLGEVLKAHRTECKMTQEFVAEHMGVTRQTVSKWETGINEPSTSNLLQLAKLFGIPADELLNEIKL